MSNVVNSKRVFYVAPHMVVGYADILGKRGDVTLDRLEHESPADVATPVLSTAHAKEWCSVHCRKRQMKRLHC